MTSSKPLITFFNALIIALTATLFSPSHALIATNELSSHVPQVVNQENHFEKTTPTFLLTQENDDCESLRWQVALSPDFATLVGSLDTIQESAAKVELSPLNQAHLENEATYFFRAQGKQQGQWSAWSKPFAFSLNKQACSYVQNPIVNPAIWDTLVPYFLPESFPEKAVLDRIFRKRPVLTSINEMHKAGFIIITKAKEDLIVAWHPKLKGYLIKVYLDTCEANEWWWWKRRIDGAHIIQASIDAHGYQDFMKVPLKWIYPLPANAPSQMTEGKKNFILVVEEMKILNYEDNRKAYKTQMTPRILDAFYTILTENVLQGSVYDRNVPFCKDGKLTFLDTEHHFDYGRPLPIENVGRYLNDEMRNYWQKLIEQGGPQ